MKKIFASFCITFVLLGTPAIAAPDYVDEVTFRDPDIKNEFCGTHIDFKYCKCAFHNQYCGSIELDSAGADTYLQSQFALWVQEKKDAFKKSCQEGSGVWQEASFSCWHCINGYKNIGGKCVSPEDQEKTEAEDELNGLVAQGFVDRNCNLTSKFEQEWKDLSDLKEAILPSDRSPEAQEYDAVLTELAEDMWRAIEIEEQMEIDRVLRLELREYRKAVVHNLKVNLLRSFWRLSYATYTTVKGGAGTAGSYQKVVEGVATNNVTTATIGEGLKFVQGIIPKGSSAEIDTKENIGKAKSVAYNAGLEALSSMGDPLAVGQQVAKDLKGLAVPGPDLSEEEIGILRDQHLKLKDIDFALNESYIANRNRRIELEFLKEKMQNLRGDLEEIGSREKGRIGAVFVDECKKLKKTISGS